MGRLRPYALRIMGFGMIRLVRKMLRKDWNGCVEETKLWKSVRLGTVCRSRRQSNNNCDFTN